MPKMDVPATAPGLQTATFAGGCFWGVQAVFQHVEGVTMPFPATPAGPGDADYKKVTAQEDWPYRDGPRDIRSGQGQLRQALADFLLGGARSDPERPARQRYRSPLPLGPVHQHSRAGEDGARLYDATRRGPAFDKPITTTIDTSAFYPAEAYHQDYLQSHPTEPYIVENDLPLVANLHRLFPQVWRAEPIKTSTGQQLSHRDPAPLVRPGTGDSRALRPSTRAQGVCDRVASRLIASLRDCAPGDLLYTGFAPDDSARISNPGVG